MSDCVACDFESTYGSGIVHTICLVPFKIGHQVTKQKGVLIVIKDVVKCEVIQENPDVRKKIASSIIDVANYDLNLKYLDFHNAISFMVNFIEKNGGTIISHNLLDDLKFLVNTQEFIGGKRIIKKKLKEYPDTGTYDKRWENFTKICSMSLINNRCDKFTSLYHAWCKENTIPPTPNGYYPTRLENFTRFVKNDLDYYQSHSAVQDTIDLFNILKSVIRYDGKRVFDGQNYLVKPNWAKVDYSH